MLRTFSGLAGAFVLVLMGRAAATPSNPPHPYVEPVVVAAVVAPAAAPGGDDPSKAPGAAGAAAAPGQGG